MRVARDEPVAVFDLNELAVLGVHIGKYDFPARGGDNGRPRFGWKIDAFVKRVLAGERIDPVSKVGREPRIDDRQSRWKKLAIGRVLHEQCFEHAELVGTRFDLTGETIDQRGKFVDGQRMRRLR